MKAAWFSETGPAREVLKVGEMDRPEPGAGEVLVRVHASGVNPSDAKKRAGAQPPGFRDGFVIPHSDGAGVIVAQKVCARCPVADACREYALANNITHGVWGGTSERQRRRILRDRRRASKAARAA